MEKWKCLEKKEDIMYVIDMDRHELVYMNEKAEESFHVNGGRYIGKKCYEILLGAGEPCPFCAEKREREKQFRSWKYENKELKKGFLVKDSVTVFADKRYRITAAVDMSDSAEEETECICRTQGKEFFVSRCLLNTFKSAEPSQEIAVFFQCFGKYSRGSRISLYEIENNFVVNLVDWSAGGKTRKGKKLHLTAEQKAFLEPYSVYFRENETVAVSQAGKMQAAPGFTEYLDVKESDSLIFIPLHWEQETIAFMMLVNVPEEERFCVISAGKDLSYLLSSILIRKKNLDYLRKQTCYDRMTGVMNRYAVREFIKKHSCERLGIIFCDANGLKHINDTQGHKAGDMLIIKIAHILTDVFLEKCVYRMGGDEFLVADILSETEEQFQYKVCLLKERFAKEKVQVSIGEIWQNAGERNFDELCKVADERMYMEKSRFYYKAVAPKEKISAPDTAEKSEGTAVEKSAFRFFVENYYFNMEVFMNSIALERKNLYLYCGDMQKNLFYISDNMKEDFGFSSNLVYNLLKEFEELIVPEDVRAHQEEIARLFNRKCCTHNMRFRAYNKKHDQVCLQATGSIKWEEKSGTPLFFSGCLTQMEEGTEIDKVTGLPAIQVAQRDLEYMIQEKRPITVFGFSLKNFEDINLTYGYEKGDQILKKVALCLEQKLGHNLSLFRMEGPEFLIIVSGEDKLNHILDTVKKTTEQVYEMHNIPAMFNPVSVGALKYPYGGKTARELIDSVRFIVKTAKNIVPGDGGRFQKAVSKIYTNTSEVNFALNRSIRQGFRDFYVVIQPQVSVSGGNIIGGEVLLRWRNKGKEVSPEQFIPYLEQSGLITYVGKWVFGEAIRILAKTAEIAPDFRISVNMSYRQLVDVDLVSHLKIMLQKNEVSGEKLIIEMTEHFSDEKPELFERFMDSCRKLGISFALDDFGTGYSSLQFLLRHEFDVVKIDKTLLKEAVTSKRKREFIKSIIYACHRFEEKVCIEGVEDEEGFELIKNTDSDYIQGYYFYKPMEEERLYKLLKQEV